MNMSSKGESSFFRTSCNTETQHLYITTIQFLMLTLNEDNTSCLY
jgi:hypothetical protein